MSPTWHVMSRDRLLVSVNWRRLVRQPTDTYICLYWRIMWSEPVTHSSDELAHDRDRTAVNHKPGQVPPPPLNQEPTWELRMAPHQKWYYPRLFITAFSSSSGSPGPEGKTCNWGNSTKSTNHQRDIMEHPIWIGIWLHARRHKHGVENWDGQSRLMFLHWI